MRKNFSDILRSTFFVAELYCSFNIVESGKMSTFQLFVLFR